MKGIVPLKHNVCFGKWKDRRCPPRRLSGLHDVKRAETNDRGPEVQSSWTVASEQSCYIKIPSLFTVFLLSGKTTA